MINSSDGGMTWQEANNGLDNLYVGSLFMHPENPDILLAGAGNNQYFYNSGIYFTTNGAQNWTPVSQGFNLNINSVEFSITDPQIAYAGADNNILRSNDGGQTWNVINPGEFGWGAPGVRSGFPIDFQVDPRNPERIFANNYGGGNFLIEDGGQTWQVASTGYTGAQMRALDIDPEHPGLVYGASRNGIFRSLDGGAPGKELSIKNFTPWNGVHRSQPGQSCNNRGRDQYVASTGLQCQ